MADVGCCRSCGVPHDELWAKLAHTRQHRIVWAECVKPSQCKTLVAHQSRTIAKPRTLGKKKGGTDSV
eukprot:2031925-Amphidinium_carterae.1